MSNKGRRWLERKRKGGREGGRGNKSTYVSCLVPQPLNPFLLRLLFYFMLYL